MKQRKKRMLLPLLALILAGTLTLLAGLGVLKGPDLAASDALYQRRAASDGEIVLIGIDQRALEELGPYNQWSREIIAQTIESLNAVEDCRPAVIGVDILFAGESNQDADARLVQAAERYGNVVTACAAEIGTALAERNGDYYLEEFSVLSFDEPFQALAQVTEQGHINAMLDSDGILRHHMLTMTLPDGRQVPSMALVIADRYRALQGAESVQIPETDTRGFWYLPFFGQPGGLNESISVVDVLSGKTDPVRFARKIVLIGPYTTGLQDSYFTAADHSRPMYGVEFQANAIQALLWEGYKTEVKDGLQLAVLFVLLAVGLAGFWRRKIRWAAALWLLLSGGWIALCLGAYQVGWVLHVLWVPAGITVLFAVCLAFNYAQAAMDHQRIRKTFERYVAPEIVGEILKEGANELQLEGRTVPIAVLFVDIRGFTKMSEELRAEPKKVVGILNEYLTFISACIMRNGGTLDKFVGDAVMAFWGAPLRGEDFEMKAARAALEMVDGMEELSGKLKEKFGYGVSYGVGIHLGEAVVGNTGSKDRMDYTAIGDTVNTAARLEAQAPAGVIYISRAVANALVGRISVTSLASSIPLKNKEEDVEILTLDGIL